MPPFIARLITCTVLLAVTHPVAAAITVSNNADSGPGSLRAAVAAALTQGGADEIVFAAGLSGQTITLTSGEIATGAQTLLINASALAGGITVSGNQTQRILNVSSGADVELRRLILTKGQSPDGGAVRCDGKVTVRDCQFKDNAGGSGFGGAIYALGVCVAETSTFTGNTSFGGAIYSANELRMTNCTMTQNSGGPGGAITNRGSLFLNHCTLAENGGLPASGVYHESGSTFTLTNSIIYSSGGGGGGDVWLSGPMVRTGANIIKSLQAGGGGDAGPAPITVDPRLRPLGFYGGSTPTMPPGPDSPALDRISSSPFTSDQRGLPRPVWGAWDIGAVEAGVQADCAWEVREVYRSPATALNSLNDALALIADPTAISQISTPGVINRSDPANNGGGGFFGGDDAVACDDKTPQGLTNGDDNDFAMVARTFINITAEDDYTFGFNGSEGARLRVFGAVFGSSTRVNTANPANPAHTGDTLTFPGLTDNAVTLGVCHLTPGVYPVEFVTWEHNGAAFTEVFAARGAQTAMNASFRLLGDTTPGGTTGLLTALPLPQPWTQEFEDGAGGFTVTNVNGPFEGPWTRDPVNGTWDTAGQGTEAVAAPSTLLTGPSLTMQCSGTATLRFTHRYSFEDGNWDGGQVRLSVNGGPFLLVPGTAFSQGGYTGTVNVLSIADIRGQEAFVVDSTGYAVPLYATAVALLGTFNAGDTLRVQFLASFDRDNRRGNPAWEVDSVSLEQQCAAGTPGWEVTTIHNGADSMATALNQLYAQWSGVTQPNSLTSLAAVVNYQGPAGGGGHGPAGPFPGDTAADDDQFAVGARATLNVPVAGDYTFCLLADETARLRMRGTRWWTVSGGPAAGTLVDGFLAGGGADVFGQVTLTAGPHALELALHENAGNAQIGLWAARGRHTAFNPDIFTLVGSPGAVQAEPPFSLTRQAGLLRPVNDDFAGSVRVDNNNTARLAACTTGAGVEAGEPVPPGTGATVWWSWSPAVAGTYVLDTEGSDFDTVLAVYTGFSVGSLTQVAGNDNSGMSTAARITITVPAFGNYRVQAAGAGGVSGRLVLKIAPATVPANNAFAAAASLDSHYSISAAGANDGASAEAGEPAHVPGVPAQASLWFTWTAPASGTWLADTRDSRLDTVLAVYTGTALTGLTKVAYNDDISPAEKQSAAVFSAMAGTTYRIAVDGRDAAARGTVRLNLTHFAVVTGSTLSSGPLPASPRTFHLVWRSEPWTTYRIESSPDLSTWSTVLEGLPSTGASTQRDIGGLPANVLHGYFRVRRD